MSINSNEIKNYNLSQKLFLEVLKEFEGYLMGLSKGDITTFSDSITKSEVNAIKDAVESNKDKSLESIRKEIIPNIFDRSIGKYFTKDILQNSSLGINTSIVPENIGDYINIIYGSEAFVLGGTNNFVNTTTKSKEGGSNPRTNSINDAIGNVIITKTIKDPVGDNIYVDPNAENPEPKNYISGIVGDKEKGEDRIYVNENNEPNRFKSPHLVATVIKHPKLSIANKNSNHLPIFFNGISPIEMSRCTPYLDIRLITKQFNKSPGVNLVTHFRFIKNKIGNTFELDDGIGYSDFKPFSNNENSNESNLNYSYMDIFTSPQTLSNADINNKTRLFDGPNNNNPVLEPIMPLLTLKSAKVDISGKGYGLMASKTASLEIILHDRSRMSEIAPLVSSNQIAGTKMYLEFGWNHPEGGITSDNSIGKYLNSLKDSGFYQVYSSNYKFLKGGAVSISLKLAASGFRETEVVHIGAGPVVPGNVVEELVEQAVNEIISEQSKSNNIKEVRKKLKTNSRNARDIYTHFSWEDYRSIAEGLNKSSENFYANNKILKEKLKYFIATVSGAENANESFTPSEIAAFNNLNLINNNKEEKRSTMIQNMYSKLEYIQSNLFKDPFLLCFLQGSNQSKDVTDLESKSYKEQKKYYMDVIKNMNSINGTNSENIGDHVSLGSLISSFIAYPLTSTCLYDEVNVVFHPLNYQAGGARKYTTANLPIPIEKVKEVLQDAVKKNSSLNINTFLNLIERKILKNRDMFSYGLNSLYKDYSDLDSKTDDEKVIIISNIVAEETNNKKLGLNEKSDEDKNFIAVAKEIASLQQGLDSEQFSSIRDKSIGNKSFKSKALKVFNNHKSNIKSSIRSSVSGQVSKLYEADGLNSLYPPTDEFTIPNITIDFEVSPVVDIDGANQSQNESFFRKFLKIDNNVSDSEGVLFNKSILTLHVYDQETVLSPYEYALLKTKTEGLGSVHTDVDFYKKIEEMSFHDIKHIIKRSYPTINYGAMSATVKNIDFSANTSGKLANVLIVDSFENVQNAHVKGRSYETPYESTTLFPAKITLECAGMPMIGRGNNIFVDFGTDTTLDNVYTVSSVSHNISAGNFISNIKMTPVNMGTVSSFRDKLLKLNKKIET